MESANRSGNSPTYVDYYAVTKAGVTSVSLMALSIVVMKGIERYAKRTIMPLQKNFAGIILSTVYLVAAARFWGPLTKINPLSSSSDRDRETSKTVPSSKDQSSLNDPITLEVQKPNVIVSKSRKQKTELSDAVRFKRKNESLAGVFDRKQQALVKKGKLERRQFCVLKSQRAPISLLQNPNPSEEHYESKMQEPEDSFEILETDIIKEEEFDILDGIEGALVPQDWEIARAKLMSSDYLSIHTMMNYASLLQKKSSFTFVDTFLFPGLVEGSVEKSSWEAYLDDQVLNSLKGSSTLIFIPLILESSPGYYLKTLPWIGSGLASYCPDHVVILTIDLKESTFEYYNSQGGDYKEDGRHVLGFKQSLADVAAYMKTAYERNLDHVLTPLYNPHAVQTDWSNCGMFVYRFMKLRRIQAFNTICTDTPVNIQQERLSIAAALKREYSPDPLQIAESQEDVIAYLEAQHLRMYQGPAQEILLDNSLPYNKEGIFNTESLFSQIDRDLQRHHEGMSCFVLGEKVYDGTLGSNAQNIYDTLLILGRKREEVLTWMSLLQQGIFGTIEMNIWKDLEIMGPDSGFQVRGQGLFILQRQKEKDHAVREYRIDITKTNPIIKATAYYELVASDIERKTIFREKPYAVLKATVEVNLNTNQTISSWVVDEVIEH